MTKLNSLLAVLALAGCYSMPHAQVMTQGGALVGANGMTLYTFDKDMAGSGVRLNDGVYPSVSAKARVNRAISQNTLVEQSALVQPDGTLKLPEGQKNIVIRSTYSDVQRGADGTLRIASPVIQGNVNGNVTLYVEGKGVENITVLNSGR